MLSRGIILPRIAWALTWDKVLLFPHDFSMISPWFLHDFSMITIDYELRAVLNINNLVPKNKHISFLTTCYELVNEKATIAQLYSILIWL